MDKYKEIRRTDWQIIIIGIRKELCLTQSELSSVLGLARQSISRFETKQRTPNSDSIKKLLHFININKLKIDRLIKIGDKYSTEYKDREKTLALNLKESKELAELIGVIIGDGEIRKDGTIRISFDPKKDVNFIERRVMLLIREILGNKIYSESIKRLAFGNIAFVKFLNNKCGLKAGSKFENKWVIPSWCLNKKEYAQTVLRGLFDTDGYFGYLRGSLELMLGRFSDRCSCLVESISLALNKLKINHRIRQCNDGRYKVLITDKNNVIKFFNLVGTSNLRNIVRFLLWRFDKYEAKIELEGLNNLIKKSKLIYPKIESITLPFLWDMNSKYFKNEVKEDLGELEGAHIRNIYKWQVISRDLINRIGSKSLAIKFNINERSVRKWREGRRNPSCKYLLKLINLLKDNKLEVDDYRVKQSHGKRNN